MTDEWLSDKAQGTVNKAIGETEDQVGSATDNAELQAEDKFDKIKGEAQEELGKLKKHFSDKDN
ncbi:CsbD family protein [Filibacter tadaridae]|uniref:Stress response protein CsbD n=1 Tax=Filibacter tadaridae TaxID=2483811 RepID=A0A3P5WJV0_9BACL|nr:CsbD family protein [Filibacter tadaridae]VDC21082.1 Stress response protein CsbD [Filibacter tadaridae]